jgi:hypothetical protein
MKSSKKSNFMSSELPTTSKKAVFTELVDDSQDPDIIYSTPVKHNAVNTLERKLFFICT